jgi:hypothetical protein
MLPWLSLTVAALTSSHGIDVRGDLGCPSAEAVAAKLAPLLSDGVEAGDVAWIERVADEQNQPELRLRLVRADGSPVIARRLALRGTCEELVDAVATVLAIWTTSPAADLEAEPLEIQAANPAVAPTAVTSGQLWLGIGGGAAFVGGLASSGQIELLAGRIDSQARARLAAVAQTSRDRALGPGQVSWRRTHFALGLGRQMPAGKPWQVSVDGDLLLGWVSAAGSGFAPDDRETAFEYGVGVGVRGQRNLGAWTLWLECRGNLWPRPQRAALSDSENTVLPRFDVQALVGVSHTLFH